MSKKQKKPPVSSPSITASRSDGPLPLAVLLAAATLLYVVAGDLSGQLSLADDYGYIVQYGHYDRPLNLDGLVQMFSGIAQHEMIHDYYRPVYTLVRSIDYRLYGIAPAGYHATSLLFYLLAVGSAYWIFRKLLPKPWAAFGGALLFAFHPLHVEPVAWIMAGGYAIAGGLALLSFALYLSRKTWASTLAFATAALANPPAVVVPAMVLGHMNLFPTANEAEQRSRRITLGWLSAVGAVIVYLDFVVFPQRYSRAFFDSGVAARSWLANLFATLRMMVIPLGLRTPYEGYIEKVSDPRWMAGAAGLLLIGAGVVVLRKRCRSASFGLFWLLVGVLPTITVWKNATGMADRYVFLASFGFILAAVALLSPARDGGLWPDRSQAKVPAAPAVLGSAFLLFFATVTWERVRLWHDTEALFTDTLRQDPRNIFAARTLARFYSVTVSSPEKGVPVLERAAELTTERIGSLHNESLLNFERYNLSELRNELGIASRESGHFDKAVALHQEAIAGIPDTGREAYRTAEYYFQMGLDYDRIGESKLGSGDQKGFESALEQSIWCYRQGFKRLPLLVQAYQNAGVALFRLGRFDEAEGLLLEALKLTPNNIEVAGLLAKTYLRIGDRAKATVLLDQTIEKAGRRKGNSPLLEDLQRVKAEAVGSPAASDEPSKAADDAFLTLFSQRKYEKALGVALSRQKARDVPDSSILNNIGLCYYKLARYPEAERAFLDAIKLRPDYDTAMDNLSLVYAKQDRLDLAISYADKALKLQPGDPGITRHLDAYRHKQLAGGSSGSGQ
jgi:tetratricopeptide (TPR) repeat protein